MASPQSNSNPSPAVHYGLPALGLAVLALLGFRTIGHTSIWSHLATGRWITTDGIPRVDTLSFATTEGTRWIAETWLYDLILFLVWKGGPAIATLLHVGAVLAAFALLLPLARRLSGPTSALFGILLSAWLIAPVFEVRSTILILPIPALFLFLLSAPRAPAVRWAGILIGQVLWTNTSATFLIGPIICAAFAFEATAKNRQPAQEDSSVSKPPPAGPMWILAAASLAVTLLNPYGPLVYQKLVWILTDPAAGYAREWISPFSTMFQSEFAKSLSTVALAVGATGLLLYREKLPTGLTITAVVCAAITVITGQNLQLFAVLAFPFFALSFDSLGRFLNDNLDRILPGRAQNAGRLAVAAAAAIALASIGVIATSFYYRTVGSASGFGLGVNEDLVPKEADILLSQPTFPARALNLIMDGGYLRWAYPDRKMYFDSRTGLYNAVDLREVLAGLTGSEEAYPALMKKWDPQAIILNATWPGCAGALPFLLQTGDWTLAYFDGTTPILLRAVPELASLATHQEAQQHGLDVLETARSNYRKQIEGPLGAPISARLVGAGSTFYVLQRFEEAAAAYDLLLGNAPSMKAGWLQFGVACLQQNRTDEAITALETACDRVDKNAASWLWLSRAYASAGRDSDASRAFARAGTINPEVASRFGNPVSE